MRPVAVFAMLAMPAAIVVTPGAPPSLACSVERGASYLDNCPAAAPREPETATPMKPWHWPPDPFHGEDRRDAPHCPPPDRFGMPAPCLHPPTLCATLAQPGVRDRFPGLAYEYRTRICRMVRHRETIPWYRCGPLDDSLNAACIHRHLEAVPFS